MKADFRQQPQNIEAEQAVLSSCFLDPYSLTQALEILNPDDFYRTAHQKIFESMAALDKKGKDTIQEIYAGAEPTSRSWQLSEYPAGKKTSNPNNEENLAGIHITPSVERFYPRSR